MNVVLDAAPPSTDLVSVDATLFDTQPPAYDPPEKSTLFEAIAQNLLHQGYSIHPHALPLALSQALFNHLQGMPKQKFDPAGIGRDRQHTRSEDIRKDEICWITGESPAGQHWLQWAAELQTYLNRRLFLGLFSFESHFAHYGPGDYYKRHLDAFRGEANRTLSLVVYLNPDWPASNGGELVLYHDKNDVIGQKVIPAFGTLVTFLSEEFPHEVLPARGDRYSIAAWFRVNTTHADRVDPPT